MGTFALNSRSAGQSRSAKSQGFFSKFVTNFVESREKEAQVYVDRYLSSLDLEKLRTLGFEANEINRLKSGEPLTNIR